MSLFHWAGLAKRNPSFVTTNTRKSWQVAKAMKAFAKDNPACAWCGRTSGVQVHHIMPVSVAPPLAGDRTNMVPLCGDKCHITVGHNGSYANSYVRNVAAICSTAERIEVEA